MSLLPEQLYLYLGGGEGGDICQVPSRNIKQRIEQEVNGTSKYVCLYCTEKE